MITGELIEANQKEVNDIYLATIGKDVDTLTTGQASDLFAIANQCPMVGGNAVFKARSLYSLIDDAQQYDDSALCMIYGIEVKRLQEQRASTMSVVPNPAGDEATLVLSRALVEQGVLVAFNAVGEEVLRVAIHPETQRTAFSTVNLAPALYHYKVLAHTGVLGNGKLTIVR